MPSRRTVASIALAAEIARKDVITQPLDCLKKPPVECLEPDHVHYDSGVVVRSGLSSGYLDLI